MIDRLFNFSQYVYSDTARENKIEEQFKPTLEIIYNLQLLHQKIVLPLFDYLTGILIITSGYRCERLNTAVGGVKNSEHIKGMAVDLNYFYRGVKADIHILEAVHDLNLKYRQLGDEHHMEWVHISYNPDDLKMQIF